MKSDIMFIDTHKTFKNLVAAGFNEKQAEAVINTVSDSNEQLATKSDIHGLDNKISNLENKINSLENRLIIKLGGVIVVIIPLTLGIMNYLAK